MPLEISADQIPSASEERTGRSLRPPGAPMRQFKTTCRRVDSQTLLLEVAGEIDLATESSFRKVLDEAKASRPRFLEHGLRQELAGCV